MKIRVVFDCMVFLQGAANKTGPSGACLQLVQSGEVELFWSPKIAAEVREVLARPKIQKKFPSLTPTRVDAFLATLDRHALSMDPTVLEESYCRDPKDEKYLQLAAACSAKYLVSRDKDLLDLMEEVDPSGIAFRKVFPAAL